MSSYKKTLAATALLLALPLTNAQSSGSGTTTRYWDCCKPSCAWAMSSLTNPVTVCDASDKPLASGANTASGCAGGSAYMCSSQSPWAVSDSLAYGFAAVSSANSANCCSCYKLTFTSTAIKGKTMIVQATNTGGDVGATQFDLAMPGGGFGIFDGCSTEWGAKSAVWGAQYGGPSTNTCSQFPKALQPGCGFRWDWMEGADNPTVDWETVACPAEIVAKSGCEMAGSTPVAGSSSSAAAGGASSVAPAGSSSAAIQAPASIDTSAAHASSSSVVVAGGEQSTAQGGTGPAATSASAAGATTSAGFVEYGKPHHYPAHRYRPSGAAHHMPSPSTAAEAENAGVTDDEENQDECEP